MSTGTAKVTASSLNVRKSASASSAKLGSLAKGTSVNYYGEENGWLQIKYNGMTSYIAKSYTTITSTTSSSGGSSSSSSSSSSSATLTSAQITAAINYNKKNCQSLATRIQTLVGVTADGSFGPITVKAIAVWQSNNGLSPDGQFGPQSQAKAGFTSSGGSSSGGSTGTTAPAASTTENILTSRQVQTAITYNRNNCSSICTQIQKLVGVTADGSFGPITVEAIAKWQKANGLDADGQFGPRSREKAGINPEPAATQPSGAGLNPHTANYKQYASPWGPKMYSNHDDASQTYSNSACGPTAVASVIAAKVDASVTPYTLGTWAIDHKYRTYNNGTSHAFVPAVAQKYGMSATNCSVETGVQKMMEGHYCVAAMGPGYWTTQGHYITPYASDGSTIYVDDPGHSSRPNGFKQSKSKFKNECSAMWYFS